MIWFIQGRVLALDTTFVTLLPSGGLWYDIFINEKTYGELVGRQDVELYIHHHITENSQSLFGFITIDEKNLFLELIKISGIGGKVALQILAFGSAFLIRSVQAEDNKSIEKIKGIWKKMAEKIILELKDKDFVKNTFVTDSEEEGKWGIVKRKNMQIFSQIIETLVNMGYGRQSVEEILQTLPEGMENPDEILPYVIKNM